ncbi:unnamed protein product [Lepidochelys olivacea]
MQFGTAMGTRMAPQYANIFMADLEQRFLSSRPLKPLLYLRYIDDIFIIWTHGKEALEEFHHDFNNFHPTTNLSLVQSTQEIHFLDTTVLINNGHINTTLYRKPTDRYSYLHASSFHPDHTTRSIVYSQALRYNRICSNPSDRDKHLQDLCQAFLQLQYPPAEVKKQIDRARRVPRTRCQFHTIRGSYSCTSTNVIYAIMCQQCPSAIYIGQTGQSLRKRINGHKSDVKNYNIHKPTPASERKMRRRHKKKKKKAFGRREKEMEEACAPLETCCRVPLEKLTLADSLRLVERRTQYVGRYLDEVLIPPSVMTFAVSRFSDSSMESISSFPWNPSSFSLREASVARSEPLCHTREIMAVKGWEGSTHPIQDQPLPRPPVHSRRNRREQITSLDQTSAHGLDFNIRQKHLQSQLGTPTPYTESLAKMIPNAPALRPPDRDPRVKFNMSGIPFLSHEVLEELDCHLNTKRLQHEQGLPLTPQKPHTAPLLPLRAPSEMWLEDGHALPTDRRQQTCSTRLPTPVEDTTMETGRSDGTAGNQTNPDRCTLPAGVDLTSAPPGTVITEKMLAVTLHIDRSELRKPLPSLSGTKGTEEKLELHMERKVISGEGSCLRPGAQAGESREDLPRTQCHQVVPEAPGSGQLPRSILDSLIAGQAAHDLQINHLMEMLSSSCPLASHVSVCHLCRKAHQGKMKGKETQEETQESAELHSLRDIPTPHGFDGTVNSKLFRDQQPIRVCKKCGKLLQKRPAGSAAADLPRTSHGIPQRWTPGESAASSNHNKMPVVWLLPADRSKKQDGMGKRAPTKQPKMVSIVTSTTGLSQAGEKATGSPDASPPKPPKASRARTSSPSRNKFPVLKRIFMCLKQTFSKLQKKVKSQMSKDFCSRTPNPKFTKPPFRKARASKGVCALRTFGLVWRHPDERAGLFSSTPLEEEGEHSLGESPENKVNGKDMAQIDDVFPEAPEAPDSFASSSENEPGPPCFCSAPIQIVEEDSEDDG